MEFKEKLFWIKVMFLFGLMLFLGFLPLLFN